MALYPPAVKKLLPLDTKMDPPIKARVVILHVRDGEGGSLYPYFKDGSGGVESHFYIKYDGTVEQYRDTDYQADANVMANGFAVSIETEGLAAGTWKPAQIDAIKALLAWLHTVENIPFTVPKTWDGTGVGYHILFEDQWDQRHASCPGPNRIAQFKNVLVPWMAAGGSEVKVSFDDAEEKQIRANVRSTPITLGDGTTDTLEKRVASLVSSLAALDKKVSGLAPAQPTVITDAQLERVLRKVVGSVDNTPPA